MSDCNLMRLRSLPDGSFQLVQEAGWEGNMLRLSLSDLQQGLTPGVLVEIESDAKLYLGEVRQNSGSDMTVMVEHSLDRARLASLQDIWR